MSFAILIRSRRTFELQKLVSFDLSTLFFTLYWTLLRNKGFGRIRQKCLFVGKLFC